MLTANDPRSNWIAGQLDRGDIEAQVRHFAAARVAAPDNRLYLASLATACLEPVQPRLPECDGVDRLADWATRDMDNGWPTLLLAERARKHKNPEAMLALSAAGGGPAAIRRILGSGIPGILGGRARDTAGGGGSGQARTCRHVCDDALPRMARRRPCDVHGQRPASERGAFRVRATRRCDAGTRLDLDVAAAWRQDGRRQCGIGGGSRGGGQRRSGSVRAQIAACSRSTGSILDGLEADDQAARAKSVAEWDRWLRREAAVGEARACAERLGATSTVPSKAR